MYRIKYKVFALVLALVMSASLIGAAFLLDGTGSDSVASSGDKNGISLTEDDSVKLADTSSAFSDSIVDISPAVSGNQWLIVSLEGKSLSARSGDEELSDYLDSENGEKASKQLQNEQKDFLSQLSKAGIPYEYKYGYTLLLNAVAINVDVKYADQISEMSGVTSVDISEYYYAPQDEEVNNDANAWATGIYEVDESLRKKIGSGEGMVAAVLDTGLDASHPAFSQPLDVDESLLLSKEQVQERIFEGDNRYGLTSVDGDATVDDVYYSEKVPFAYDYADKDTDVYPSYSAHGTHVAGIIAGADLRGKYCPGFTDEDGNLVDIDGNLMENANGENMQFTGVAPNAQLAIFKVFSDKEVNGTLGGAEEMDILRALEDCVKLGVDVINMSLGSSAGFSTGDNDNMQRVYDSVRNAGISLVVAASNDYSSSYGGVYGTNLTSNPDSATVGSPSTFPGALSVASINGQYSKYLKTVIGGEDKFLYFTEASDGNNNEKDFVSEIIASLTSSGVQPEEEQADGQDVYAVQYQVVPGYGMAVNYTRNVNVTGKIAVVRRGGNVSFEDKVRIAMQHGAIGCVIYNNVSGIIRMSLGNLTNPVPTCSITMDTADSLVKAGSGTMYVSQAYMAGPFMSDFSSWGPTPDLQLKPEISAHGGEIISSVPNGWAEYSGTSMASPNMAGAMSLILAYVENNYGSELAAYAAEGLNHDAVAMSNFLVMSTATIAYDESGLPYSPRKQGAGLADITKAITTQAYLYSEGMDKAKIQIGDDPQKTGVYNLTFHARNMSDSARKYILGTETMTETVSSDGISVAERAYMLDDMADISFRVDSVEGGAAASAVISEENQLTLGADTDAVITVTIKLNSDAKKYLDDNFENGMYVEGFVTLEDVTTGSSEKVDLNIPWLGFYGDWYAAPMLDISQYDLDAALSDDSIPDDKKPEAAIYPTVPLGSYYNKQYIIPLGSYLYDQDPNVRQIYATADKAAISIYDTEDHRTVSQLYGIYAGMLRGAEEVTVVITDAVTGQEVFRKSQKNVRKSFTAGSSTAHGSLIELDWNAAELGLSSNRQYLVHMEGVLASMESRPYDPSKYTYNRTFDFNFYIDTQAPEIVDYRVRYEPYKDENDKTQYSVYLDVDVYDNHYSQAIALCYVDYDSMSLEMLQPNMTPIYSSRNSVTTVSLDITDFYDQDLDLYVQVGDYALNERAYRLETIKSMDDAATYPDSIDIVTGDDVANQADYDKQISINVNQAVDLETTVTPANSTYVNLFWHSFNENVVRVEDGTIFGVAPGTALVKVYGGRSEYSGASAGILVTVTDQVDPEPSVTGLELGLIKDSYNNLVNPTNTTVSVHPNEAFNLDVIVQPWYSSVEPVMVWKSSAPQFATVDPNTGYVQTIAEGSTTITGTLQINGKPSLYSVSTTLSVGPEFVVKNGYLQEYHGKGGEVTIPKNLNVYYIFEEAFADNANITSLEISSPCTEIQQFAFANMKALKKVIFPESVEYVHAYAFYGCTNLEEVYFHSRAITIGDMVFAGCTSLKTIQNIKLLNGNKAEDVEILDLKEGVDYTYTTANMTSVGIQSFFGCTSLESLDLTQLRKAGQAAFAGCTSLEYVKLSRYTSIADDMFLGCIKLSTLEYTDVTAANIDSITYGNVQSPFDGCNITQIKFADSADVIVVDSSTGAIYGDAGMTKLIKVLQNVTEFTVPASVTEIAPNAFSGNASLKKVTFAAGGNLEKIGAYAFSGTGISEITIPATVTYIGEGAFSWCENLTKADLSAYAGTIPEEAFSNSSVSAVTWGAGITAIASRAFYHTALTTLDLTGTAVTSIGDSAFASCPYLRTVKLGAVSELGSSVFAAGSNTSLKSVSFGEGSDTLGTYTFYGQSGLTTLSLPASILSLKEIGDGVFYMCSSLESDQLAFTSLETIGASTFAGCDSLTTFNVSALKTIGTQAFSGCSELVIITLENVTTIGARAFEDCAKIETIVAKNLTDIGDEAFLGTSLSSITYPSIKNIGKYAFAYTQLEATDGTLVIPETVETIGEGAFSGLTALTAFSIDSSNKNYTVLDGILYETFENDSVGSAMQVIAFPAGKGGEITLADTTVRVGASAFENAKKVTKVNFPYVFKAIGDKAFFACSAKVYEFECLTAPVLEAQPLTADDFEVGSDMYNILDRSGSIASQSFYGNFVNYLALKLFNDRDEVKHGIEDFGLTVICPDNATGFDGRLYSEYFSTIEHNGLMMDDYARNANALIAVIPTADQINALTAADTATWAQYKETMQQARSAFNLVSAVQLQYVNGSENLLASEKAMRDKASVFGEKVTQSSISILTMPTKMSYIRGEKFDPTGLVLTLVWSDGSRENITSGYEIVNGDRELSLSDRTIQIKYGSLSTSLNVTVSRPAVDRIEVESYPANQAAQPGDAYVSAGLVLKVIYVDQVEELVYTVSSYIPQVILKEGENTITINYGDKTLSYVVTLKDGVVYQPGSQIPEDKPDTPDDGTENKGGCSSVVNGVVAYVAAVAVIVVAAAVVRRKKNS